MNIGFDLDGVFFNQEKFQLKKGSKYFKSQYIKQYYIENGINLKKSDVQVFDVIRGKILDSAKKVDFTKPYLKINSNGYGIRQVFDCSEEEEEKFWYKHMLLYALFMPFRKDAVRVAKQLYKEGNELFIISSRAKADENSLIGKIQRGIVILRFKLKGMPYKKMIFCPYKNGQESKG